MANKIVETIYRLKDQVSAGLAKIGISWKGAREDVDKTSTVVDGFAKRASAGFVSLVGAVKKFGAALLATAAVVALSKIKDGIVDVLQTGERFEDLGKKFSTAFGGLAAGTEALERVRTIAAGTPFAFEEVAAAAVDLKKRGIDPLDGSLQALLDNAAANDQSIDDLRGTIEALGKAAIKGEVGTRALVSLTEKGIPVFKLLGDALGKTEEQIREMAKSGQLGAAEIKLLVAELGKLRAGAAADEVGDLDAQLVKLRDSLEQVKNSLAQGSLDVARQQFADLNAAVAELAASPEFEKLRESLTGTFEAGVSAFRSLTDNINAAELLEEIRLLTEGIRASFELLGTVADAGGPIFEVIGALEKMVSPLKVMKTFATQAFKEIADGLRELRGETKETSEEIEASIAPWDALGTEIEIVTDTIKRFKAGFTDAAIEAKRSEEISAAFKAIGVDAQSAGVEVTEAGEKMISQLSLLARESKVSGDAFKAAFTKVLDAAQTEEEARRIAVALKQAFDTGKISAADMVAGNEAVRLKLVAIKEEAQKAQGVFASIGKAAEDAARQSIVAWEIARSQLAAVAEGIAAKIKEAMKAGGESAPGVSALKDQLTQTETQIKGLTNNIETTKGSLDKAGEKGQESFQKIQTGAEKAGAAAEQVGDQAGAGAEQAGQKMGGFLDLLQQLNEEFAATSEAARLLFVFNQKLAVGFEAVGKSIQHITQRTLDAAEATRQAIAAQEASLGGIVGAYDAAAEAGEAAGISWQQASALGEDGLRAMAEQARNGISTLNLLNQADLDRLADSADRAADKIAQIEERTRSALIALEELTRAEQDEADRSAGNEEAIEKRRHEARLREIAELAAQGDAAAQQQAEQARRLAERNHLERLRQIEVERQSRARADAESGSSGGAGPGGGGGSAPRGGGGSGNAVAAGAPSLTFIFNGPVLGSDQKRLEDDFARVVRPGLQRLDRLNR